MHQLKLGLLLLLALSPSWSMQGPIEVYGFEDFCYSGECWTNPSAGIALALGGRTVVVSPEEVATLPIEGPSLGIGLDPTTDKAYICSSSFGERSLAYSGADAGTYLCGELYYRQLQISKCSLFVHIPESPTASDQQVVQEAYTLVQECLSNQAKEAAWQSRGF